MNADHKLPGSSRDHLHMRYNTNDGDTFADALLEAAGPGRPPEDSPPVNCQQLKDFTADQFDRARSKLERPRLTQATCEQVRENILRFANWSAAYRESLKNHRLLSSASQREG
jgi:hypothetical protein